MVHDKRGVQIMKQLKTRWADHVDVNNVLGEYPRPLMRRKSYVNLNGTWKYAIRDTKGFPKKMDGEILVPFSPEAVLSGVNRQLKPQEYLWYKRRLPQEVRPEEGKRWLLHFGAVDQYAAIYINGKKAGSHLGGYLPFSIDVTEYLREENNYVTVKVRDFTDTSYHSRGKQKLKRGGMFYTAQSGIWQTVWMEQVPERYIAGVKITPLYDHGAVMIQVDEAYPVKAAEKEKEKNAEKDILEELVHVEKDIEMQEDPIEKFIEKYQKKDTEYEVTITARKMWPVRMTGRIGTPLVVKLPYMRSWSPEDPFLYDVSITMEDDQIDSYFAMRKIEVKNDDKGIPRMYLNNAPYFQKGVLDQGYWPDGLYTAPTDEAMIYDIQKMKDLGFNMIRKHIKIEPQRWYYHCDRIGMLVWQDMVNGGREYKSWYVTYLATAMELFHIRARDNKLHLMGSQDAKGRKQFEEEMKQTVKLLYNHPSIVVWVVFNEGWGQFETHRITDLVREADPDRLIDSASGWFDQGSGDIRSIHEYFFPLHVKPEKRVTALTEFGGYSMSLPGHSMYDDEMYGYKTFKTRKALTKGYEKLIRKLVLPNIRRGLSATIYTQLSDVEEEVNGIVTYDRKRTKINEKAIRKMNEMLHF